MKSSLFPAGVHRVEAVAIEDSLNFSNGAFPFRYLGIPISASKLRSSDYTPLLERIAKLVKAWTSLTLSYAGKLELLKSVVQGVSCYWFSIFPIPAMVIDFIESICRTFLWGSKVARVSWRQVCLPKEEGGLGLRDLRTWNKELLAKNLWNIHTRKDALWVKWVNEFFLRGCPTREWSPNQDVPPIFKNLIRIRYEMIDKAGSIHGAIAILES